MLETCLKHACNMLVTCLFLLGASMDIVLVSKVKLDYFQTYDWQRRPNRLLQVTETPGEVRESAGGGVRQQHHQLRQVSVRGDQAVRPGRGGLGVKELNVDTCYDVDIYIYISHIMKVVILKPVIVIPVRMSNKYIV